MTLANHGVEKLEVELRDPKGFIRNRFVELLPGERCVFECTLDVVDMESAGKNDWEILLLSNTSTRPYDVQTVKCSADVVTLGPAEAIEHKRKVFFTEPDTCTFKLKRSDGKNIRAELETPPDIKFLSVKVVSEDTFEITFKGGRHQRNTTFELPFVDRETNILKYVLRLEYEIIYASAEIYLKSKRRFRAKPKNTVKIGVKNTSDAPLKLLDVSRSSGESIHVVGAGKTPVAKAKRIIPPHDEISLRYPIKLGKREMLFSYQKHDERVTIRANDQNNPEQALELKLVSIPFFSKTKRFVATFVVCALVALYGYLAYVYCWQRGVMPFPRVAWGQVTGSVCNIPGLEAAYNQGSILGGDLSGFNEVIDCLESIANPGGRRKIAELNEHVAAVNKWIDLTEGKLAIEEKHELLAGTSSADLKTLPVPVGDQEHFYTRLENYLLGEVEAKMKLVRTLMISSNRSGSNDKRTGELLSQARHPYSLAGVIAPNSENVRKYYKEIEKYFKILNNTSYVKLKNVPIGSEVRVDGTLKESNTRNPDVTVIANNEGGVRVVISNRKFYPLDTVIRSADRGTTDYPIEMQPRGGILRWRPKDQRQPTVDYATAVDVSSGKRTNVSNGASLPPGEHTVTLYFSNGGSISYTVNIKSIETTMITYECMIGTLRVQTIPAAKIYQVGENGVELLKGENGRAIIEDYYGNITVRCVPKYDIYRDSVVTVNLEKPIQELNVQLTTK
jgi:hypothetical protein